MLGKISVLKINKKNKKSKIKKQRTKIKKTLYSQNMLLFHIQMLPKNLMPGSSSKPVDFCCPFSISPSKLSPTLQGKAILTAYKRPLVVRAGYA